MRPLHRATVGIGLFFRDLLERAQCDWRISREPIAALLISYSQVFRLLGRRTSELRLLGSVWRSFPSTFASRWATARFLRWRAETVKESRDAVFCRMVDEERDLTAERSLRASLSKPRPFDGRLIILKAPDEVSKGVLLIKYTDYFRHFLRVFDVSRLAQRYHIVLEPSWIGYFLPDILAYEEAGAEKVFVQTWEQRDADFLSALEGNLVPVPLSPNAWISARVFTPDEGTVKEYDAVMVSLWADFKRHFALFRAVRNARCPALRVACIGQPWPRSLDSMRSEARYYGVEHQVSFFDSIDQQQVNSLYNRSKIALLLSRKEGPNKSIVEAMFAGTPAFIRAGFNYGTRYPYINESTGGFFNEEQLPDLLVEAHSGRFNSLEPHTWVRAHWNPVAATRTLEESIFGDFRGRLQVKINTPDLDYLDVQAWELLAASYFELETFTV